MCTTSVGYVYLYSLLHEQVGYKLLVFQSYRQLQYVLYWYIYHGLLLEHVGYKLLVFQSYRRPY